MTVRRKKSKRTGRTTRTGRAPKRKASALARAVAELARAAKSRNRDRTIRAAAKVQTVAAKSRAKSAKREKSRARSIERGARGEWSVPQRNRTSVAIRDLVGSLHAPTPQQLGETALTGRIVPKPRKPVVADGFLPVEEYQAIFGADPSNVLGLSVTDPDTGWTTWIRFSDPLTHWPDLYSEISARYKKTGVIAMPFGR